MALPVATRRATRLSRKAMTRGRVNPFRIHEFAHGTVAKVPDPIEFVVSDQYLDRSNLYPRQATFLKIIFLRDDMFCADEQTEILTRRGWMPYWEVVEGEDVMTISPDTGLAEWAPAERVNVFPTHGERLISMEGDGHSSLTTPNHRWLVDRTYTTRRGSRRERQFVETQDLIGVRDRIACAARVTNLPEQTKWTDAFVELAAWYWTEGHLRAGGGIVIAQSETANPAYVQRIRGCLTILFGPESLSLRGNVTGWRESRDRGIAYFRLSTLAAAELRSVVEGSEKVPTAEFLTGLTQAQLQTFIETSIDADGSRYTMPSGKVKRDITQKSKARLDALQMACSLAGVRTVLAMKPIRGDGTYAGREQWHLSLYDDRTYFTPQTRDRKFAITEVEHTGYVWCPTTKNGTWLARRNGKVYFTGNTQYDYDVIGEWEETFLATGNEGISPGILDRIAINKSKGRKWFRETQAVWGRRGSKGYNGGLAGAFVLWNYMLLPGGPQSYYGIDRDKRLTGIVFAGKKEQAQANQWRDLANIILGGPCFSRYISRPQNERLTIFAPTDILRAERLEALGIDSDTDQASFEIVPAPSTTMAARGPTSFMQFYDEQAHVISSTSHADAGEVYDSATPALDQFKKDGFIYAPSSPWTKQGKFFENWELATEMNPDGSPAYPERFMLQLPSWGPYEDWEEAQRIPLRPPKKTIIEVQVEVKKRRTVNGKRKTVTVLETQQKERSIPGPTLKPLKGAIQTYDDDMRQLERANPETFSVERRSHWAESLNAYLNAKKVEQIFAPWNGEMLFVNHRGLLDETYVAHGDPATSNKRFGWTIAHRVWVPKLVTDEKSGATVDEGIYHVVIDNIRCWEPADFEDHIIDYEDAVMPEIWEMVKAFVPEDVSFDQFNVPATIGWLRKKLAKEQLPKRVQVREVVRTRPLNWKHYELFKSAINMGLVHGPMFLREEAEDGEGYKVNYASDEAQTELKFLEEKNGVVDHPASGPVQTKDIADTLCEVVVSLIGKQLATFMGMEFTEIGLSGMAPHGTDPGRHTRTKADEIGDRLAGTMGNRRGMGNGGPARGPRTGMRRR